MALKLQVAIVVVLGLVAASACGEEWEMAGRAPGRHVASLTEETADRAALLLRALDNDFDGEVSASEAMMASAEQLPHRVSNEAMVSFVEVADTNNDGKMSLEEMHAVLAPREAAALREAGDSSLLETEAGLGASAKRRVRRGFFSKLIDAGKKGLQSAAKAAGEGLGNALRRATGNVDRTQDACVMCQYLVERCETNVRQSGAIPSMPTGDVPLFASPQAMGSPMSGSTAIPSTAAAPEGGASFVETGDAYDTVGSSVIASTHEATRQQRQMERQKYNEIYRVVDVTFDDVCEQSMPAAFYSYCKQAYQVQSDIVDGLRYQYRPSDICYRVGMCGAKSYITQGIHSRFRE